MEQKIDVALCLLGAGLIVAIVVVLLTAGLS